MTETHRQEIENRIRELKETLEKYTTGKEHPMPAAVADLTKAIHEIGDHLIDLHRRIEKIEETHPDWTTRGWTPPPGSDSPE